ncbi:hypothetical protein AWC38_SpisGene22467 [Stylophora pistillata]|uniref:Death domain-containing protein n=1 Tax=Stylophora pistillata TaxID=50429 RepID=A0A2B4R8H4_STYPI|nr:hypothetical protein AWC38_SpisGene22467 [Stylophora pistillata]
MFPYRDLVSKEGFTWILKETGVFIKFLPEAVTDPRLITCMLWKPGKGSPPLEDNESLVSNVIELDCDDSNDVVFSSIEVALTHSAKCSRGYELVMKEMTDTDGWRDLETLEVQPSDLQRESLGWQIELPFVQAKITSFSRYAVICRLKSYRLRKEDSEERSKLTISVPDFPGTCLSISGSRFPASMDLVIKVQEISNEALEGKEVLVGPIVHITFTSEAELSDPSQVSPVIISVPIDSQKHQTEFSKMSSRHVRVFFRGGKDASGKWVDWTKKLQPKLENWIVTFKVDGTDSFQINRLLECGVMLDSSTKPLEAEKLFIVDSSCPQQVGFFAYWSQKKKKMEEEQKQGSLTLCCFPIHMKTELKKEISSEHGFLLCGEAKSARLLAKGDQAFFSLSNGLTLADNGNVIDYLPFKFIGDFIFRKDYLARFEAPKIEFFKRENDKEGRENLCSLLLHPVTPFEDRSPVVSREKLQSQKQPPVCEPSTSVKSSVEDSAEIKELRKSTVTQRIAVLCKKHIGNCWRDLGAMLRVSESDLINTDKDYRYSSEKGYAVLQSWRDMDGCSGTVGLLVDALISIDEKRIAEELLDIVREEKRGESQQKDDRSEEHQELCSSPVEDIVREEKRRESQQIGDGTEEHQELCSSPVEGSDSYQTQTNL